MTSNRVTSALPVRSYGIKGDLPKMLDRLRSLEDRQVETHDTLKDLERKRSELPDTLADAERDALCPAATARTTAPTGSQSWTPP